MTSWGCHICENFIFTPCATQVYSCCVIGPELHFWIWAQTCKRWQIRAWETQEGDGQMKKWRLKYDGTGGWGVSEKPRGGKRRTWDWAAENYYFVWNRKAVRRGRTKGEISHSEILINHNSWLFFFSPPTLTFLMPLSPSFWLGNILLTSQSGRSAYWTAFIQLWIGSLIPSQIQLRPNLK